MHMDAGEPRSLEAILASPGRIWSESDFDRVTRDVLLSREFRARPLATIGHTLRVHGAVSGDSALLDVLQDFFVHWLEMRTRHPCVQKYDPCRSKAKSEREGFELWALGSIRDHARSWLKKRQNRPGGVLFADPDTIEDMPAHGPNEHQAPADDRALRSDTAQSILDCLDEIEPRQAMAFRLRFLRNLPPAECTRLLDLFLEEGGTRYNERQLVSRALQAMKECLSKKGVAS